jgi:hypothetical protein
MVLKDKRENYYIYNIPYFGDIINREANNKFFKKSTRSIFFEFFHI